MWHTPRVALAGLAGAPIRRPWPSGSAIPPPLAQNGMILPGPCGQHDGPVGPAELVRLLAGEQLRQDAEPLRLRRGLVPTWAGTVLGELMPTPAPSWPGPGCAGPPAGWRRASAARAAPWARAGAPAGLGGLAGVPPARRRNFGPRRLPTARRISSSALARRRPWSRRVQELDLQGLLAVVLLEAPASPAPAAGRAARRVLEPERVAAVPAERRLERSMVSRSSEWSRFSRYVVAGDLQVLARSSPPTRRRPAPRTGRYWMTTCSSLFCAVSARPIVDRVCVKQSFSVGHHVCVSLLGYLMMVVQIDGSCLPTVHGGLARAALGHAVRAARRGRSSGCSQPLASCRSYVDCRSRGRARGRPTRGPAGGWSSCRWRATGAAARSGASSRRWGWAPWWCSRGR